MRKIILISALCLLLCSCASNTAEAPRTELENVTTTETAATASTETSETEIEIESTTTTTPTTTTIPTTTTTTTTTFRCITGISLSEPKDSCEYDWQHAYAEYINNMDYYVGLYIDDINGDDIPEAVIKRYNTYDTIVLYYTENGLAELLLETVSDWGRITYLADTKQILFSPFYGHTQGTWGYEEYYLYDWTGTEYTETFSILRESGYYYYLSEDELYEELGQAYINGEEVDNDTFEAKFAEIKELESANSYFPVISIKDENFESYAKEKLPDFKMPEFN